MIRVKYFVTAMLMTVTSLAVSLTLTPPVLAETMTDRCSGQVSFPGSYDDGPERGTILSRGPDGWTDWTFIRVGTSGGGHIRWWCRSTTGNMFDPGTWRIEDLMVGTKCEIYTDGSTGRCKSSGSEISLGSSAWEGWTPERSRCDNRSGSISVRLGPDRLLQIQCH